MVIELFGLPGAGKSTLARELSADDTSFVWVQQAPKVRGIQYALLHLLMTVYWTIQILHEAYRTRTWQLVRFKFALLGATFAQLQVRHATKDMVFDEGMLQRMLSIYETKKNTAQMRAALRYVSLPDVLIHVVGNDARHFVRYDTKKNDRARLGDAYLATWEEMARHNYQSLLAALDERGTVYYTYDPTTVAVEDVRAYIHSHEQS